MRVLTNSSSAIKFLALFFLAISWSEYVFGKSGITEGGLPLNDHTCLKTPVKFDLADKNVVDLDILHRQAFEYLHGTCVAQNTKLGLDMMAYAANNGHAAAAHDLGEIYYLGDLIPANIDQSQKYYHMAAKAGSLKAQHELGIILLKEAETDEERHEALDWLGKAANQNDGFSAYVLGMIHDTGLHGVAKNPCLALDWYDSAASIGFTDHAGMHRKLQQTHKAVCN